VPNNYRELAVAIRRLSRTSVLVGLARDSAETYSDMQWHASLDRLRQFPWANAHVARLALVNGTDFQRKPASRADLIRLKEQYHFLDPKSEPGDLWSLMNRMLHEQIPMQHPLLNELARAWRLLGQEVNGCTVYDWAEVFGVSLGERIKALFFIHVWAIQNRGVFSIAPLEGEYYTELLGRLGGRDLIFSVIADLARTPDEFRALHEKRSGTRTVQSLAEFNDLHRFPLVRLGDRNFATPSVHLVLASVSTYNLYYRGMDAWGQQFADSLGFRVENIAGEDLSLLEDSRLIREITYGKPEKKSVDWIVVFPECVLLVECKSARMGLEALANVQGEQKLIDRYLRKAADQIDETARVASMGPVGFDAVPTDRPFYGLIVAAEQIYLGGVAVDRWWIDSTVPHEVVSLGELEEFCALEMTNPGTYIDNYFRTRNPLASGLVREALATFERGENPFVNQALREVDFTVEFPRDGMVKQ